ncbi:MAG: DUF4239 domain-containing protein [Cytophaga sp.]|uniref:bestrophin-like domain n=1 Tax=Cytophaga sp. TaxID=29535 RepID=UPI003F7D3E8F
MDYFWLYDLPLVLSFSIVVGSMTLFSIAGIFILKPFVSKWWEGHDNNDQIAFYLSAIGVFYGITLGLLAAGVWENFEDAEEKVLMESSAINALYRDVTAFPEPEREILQKKLAYHLEYIINVAWPLHNKGIAKTDGTQILTDFHQTLYSFEPKTKREEIVMAEALRQFNKISELRRLRLSSVKQGMPGIVWAMILVGAAITIAICWLFNIPSLRMHLILNSLIGIAVGSLVYLVLMLDYPFRGVLSVSSEAYQEVLEHLVR